jgi:hypothetical protein
LQPRGTELVRLAGGFSAGDDRQRTPSPKFWNRSFYLFLPKAEFDKMTMFAYLLFLGTGWTPVIARSITFASDTVLKD